MSFSQLFLPLREVSDLFASSQSASSQSAVGDSDLAASTTPAKAAEGFVLVSNPLKLLQKVSTKEIVLMLIYEFMPNATLWVGFLVGFLMVVAPKTTQGLVESLQGTQELMIALQGTQELVKAPQRDSRAGGSSTRDLGACTSFNEDSGAGGSSTRTNPLQDLMGSKAKGL
ncbi:hypothetical protein HHK36_019579 [Tetracentron sinense]|uniref:Uncharacterized protein n=1 Tax=Tetracentron sinense TaxID=13715 RepID=A0A835DCW2_TETSI|nr:hypothetical protein HHK36_019579 [Tetracentron sinense]